VALIAFFAQISDPKIGGTYMTLLNTVNNLGLNLSSTITLFVAQYLTWKTCTDGQSCNKKEDENLCTVAGKKCQITTSPYYIEVLVCSLLGALWLLICYRTVIRLQYLPRDKWHLTPKPAQPSASSEESDDILAADNHEQSLSR
ncbi:unnamed protein product, partial [Didymodactylos carnosus]